VSVNTSVEIWNFVKNYSLDGSSITPPTPAIVVPTNREEIFNGGFDSSAVAWDLQTHGDAQASGDAKDGKYKLDISAIGTQNYQVQLIQHDLRLVKDQWYEVSFDAVASAARTLEVNVEQHNDPWESYLKEKQNFEIGTDVKNFKFNFQMTAATDTNSRLSFNAGAATGTLMLDNVVLKKIDAPAESSTRIRLGALTNRVETVYTVFDMNGTFIGKIAAKSHDEVRGKLGMMVKRGGVYLVKAGNGVARQIKVTK
jgi:hypothetical protein